MAVEQEDGSAHAASSEIEEGDVLVHVTLRTRWIQRLILLAIVYTGVQLNQAKNIPYVQRKFEGLLGAHVRADVGAACHQNGGASFHIHRLRHRANL